MFFKIILYSFLLVLGTAVYYFQIRIRPNDLEDYVKMVAEHAETRPLKLDPIIQYREGVSKEIWSPKNKERTLFRLTSQHSRLSIEPKKMIEYLYNLNCCMQEEILENKQEIRTLTAEKGIYTFPSHEFLADAVEIKFFRTLGTILPNDLKEAPYLRGQATEVIFSAKDKLLHFTADHLQADLDHKQVLREGL